MDRDPILTQIETVLRAVRGVSDYSPENEHLRAATRMGAAIERLAPPGSRYRKEADTTNRGFEGWTQVQQLHGILQALCEDYRAGYLETVHEIIHASVFADFLEMGSYLLKEGYKDAAAVLAGGALEQQLRELCKKHELDAEINGRPKKADQLNADLVKVQAYTKLDQKNVTAWLDLRNLAAHGRYGEYTEEHVDLLLQGVRDFISRHPA